MIKKNVIFSRVFSAYNLKISCNNNKWWIGYLYRAFSIRDIVLLFALISRNLVEIPVDWLINWCIFSWLTWTVDLRDSDNPWHMLTFQGEERRGSLPILQTLTTRPHLLEVTFSFVHPPFLPCGPPLAYWKSCILVADFNHNFIMIIIHYVVFSTFPTVKLKVLIIHFYLGASLVISAY